MGSAAGTRDELDVNIADRSSSDIGAVSDWSAVRRSQLTVGGLSELVPHRRKGVCRLLEVLAPMGG
jgi:hypothetical protein